MPPKDLTRPGDQMCVDVGRPFALHRRYSATRKEAMADFKKKWLS